MDARININGLLDAAEAGWRIDQACILAGVSSEQLKFVFETDDKFLDFAIMFALHSGGHLQGYRQ